MTIKRCKRWLLVVGAVSMVAGCVAYKAARLDPGKGQRELMGRTLSDERLIAWARGDEGASNGAATRSTVGGMTWNLETLTRAALYLHPDLDVARAHVAAVEAGQITAGQSPNPTVGLAPQISSNAGSVNPWTIAFSVDIPIETAGKREHRISEAQALTEVARFELAEAAWQVRSRLRDALITYLLDQRAAALLENEVDARSRYAKLLEARLAAGEIARLEVDRARLDLLAARQGWRAAQSQVITSRTRLASAIGMPTSGLDGAEITWGEDLETMSSMDVRLAKELQTAGLWNRLDVRRELADYAAAEAALRLEVAKQYPDVHLGPGYEFDQGQNKWGLGLSVELPVFNRNGGPIAEAKAHRTELAAKFLALQAQVIGETETAVARYEGAPAELAEAQDQIDAIQKQVDSAKRALEAGGDRLTVTSLEVQYAAALRLRLDALRKAHEARGAIEDAIQRPLPAGQAATEPAATTTSPAGKTEEPGP